MNKLRLSPIVSEKPIKIVIEMSAVLYHDLKIYAELLSKDGNSETIAPSKLIVPMIEKFIKSDKIFKKLKNSLRL